ncbi:MAG TPA: hypothetical protein PLR07_12000 [Promineifilum sp.]|nr:hypothetical protein [Promineifilum sp.]HRO25004.1 hypothetical protein [Promineifilum sp.]
MSDYVIEQVVSRLRRLPETMQQQVLIFTQTLQASAPIGVPGRSLLTFAGAIPADDLLLMSEAIEEGCE